MLVCIVEFQALLFSRRHGAGCSSLALQELASRCALAMGRRKKERKKVIVRNRVSERGSRGYSPRGDSLTRDLGISILCRFFVASKVDGWDRWEVVVSASTLVRWGQIEITLRGLKIVLKSKLVEENVISLALGILLETNNFFELLSATDLSLCFCVSLPM